MSTEISYAGLTEKYNVAAPRYTSYPTVPYWDNDHFSADKWKESAKFSFNESNEDAGVSIYIHLPYCESLCTYCGCNTRITRNHHVELPYINAVLKEWKLYLQLFKTKPVIKEIHLGGGTPTFFSADNLAMLIEGILTSSSMHPESEFSFEAHPGNITTDHLRTLYTLGFKRLSIGIQDFDPKVQLIINRIQTVEQVASTTNIAREIGYTSVNFDLIYGLPLQTAEGLIETIRLTAGLMPDRIAFYSYAHVPWIKPGQRKFTENDLPDAQTKHRLYEIGRSLFKTYGYHDIGMDHFALPTDSLFKAERNRKLHRNFMGYTHQFTQLLVGLGVSAISDSWYGFAQNEKKVEDYIAAIEQNRLPVFKGHSLTNDDLIIRRHILNIMCNGETNWSTPENNCAALSGAIERLQLLTDDGLIVLEEHGLKVTETGKNFLRIICMAFDDRLWKNRPQTQLFSMAG